MPWPMRMAGCATPLALVAIALLPACSRAPEPIVIDGGAVTVRNLTGQGWRQVQIFVNDHYSGTTRAIPAGGSVRASLGDFMAMHGQRFNYRNTEVLSVVVRATDDGGRPVRLAWGQSGVR